VQVNRVGAGRRAKLGENQSSNLCSKAILEDNKFYGLIKLQLFGVLSFFEDRYDLHKRELEHLFLRIP